MTKGRKHCPAWQPDLLGLTTPPQSHSRGTMREVGDRWPGPQSILPHPPLLSLLGRYQNPQNHWLSRTQEDRGSRNLGRCRVCPVFPHKCLEQFLRLWRA